MNALYIKEFFILQISRFLLEWRSLIAMLRIRTREEKYQIMTSFKRATFECTEVSFIELLK